MTFDVTIPVLNEEPTLEQNVLILYDFLKKHFPEENRWKIIIADNGSTDRTPDIARDLHARHPEIQLCRVPSVGVGLALKTSWSQSEADIVGFMDLDLATDLESLLEALDALENNGYDFVYATRLHPRAKVIGRPLIREIASQGFNFLLKTYLRVGFSDGQCGFKWMHRKWFPTLVENGAQTDGWFFITETLVVAEWLGLKIYEMPVTWTDAPRWSKVKILPLAKKYIQNMIDLKKKKPKRRR